MKTLADLVLLGDPRLYEVCAPVAEADLPLVAGWVADLHNVMQEVRAKYHFGRGIAAPQLGIMKRLVYLHLDGQPHVLLNPELSELSAAMFALWDDCMCFPNLLVRVRRHESLTVTYRDAQWQPRRWAVQGAVAELVQHECDHLDGILCTMRAIDNQSFRWRP
ncbi:peptide deformylase [Hymenobacter sp. BRD128]|uniref:peptide deformylase n=1 Tax=Hymenobacter sp. BRD128 TaxID=2675878 RepID=UPI001564B7C7|nr:peptide deformylase [Hymenobacter sp. BRD128]QKG56369.1 peptide deformylase [Hymenobacter sp. BRD128]